MSPLQTISDLLRIKPQPRAPAHATVKVILTEDPARRRLTPVRLEAG